MLTRRSLGAGRGYSLVELVVALSILGVLLAAAVPSAVDWMRDLRVRGVAESMKTGLEKARMEALKSNRSVSFWLVNDPSNKVPGASCVLSASGKGWVVSVADPSSACNAAASTTTAPMLAYRSDAVMDGGQVTVESVDAAGTAATRVTFNALGQATGAGAIRRIDVKRNVAGGRTLRVMVDPGGGIRTCDRGVSAGDPRACP